MYDIKKKKYIEKIQYFMKNYKHENQFENAIEDYENLFTNNTDFTVLNINSLFDFNLYFVQKSIFNFH